MTAPEQQAILSIALLAAFADGAQDREREEIRRIAESLAGESGSEHLSTLYQDVLLKRVDADATTNVGALTTDSNGVFDGSIFLPLGFPVGDYEVKVATPGDARCGAGTST